MGGKELMGTFTLIFIIVRKHSKSQDTELNTLVQYKVRLDKGVSLGPQLPA